MDLKGRVQHGLDLIHVAQFSEKWRALTNTVMQFLVP
jgi:aryl carrier-like protein